MCFHCLFFLSCDGVTPPFPHISHCHRHRQWVLWVRGSTPRGTRRLCVFYGGIGYSLFNDLQHMTWENRIGSEWKYGRETTSLHGTVLIVFVVLLFMSTFFFFFQGLLFYVSPLEGHLYSRCTTYPLWDLLSIYVCEAYSLHFKLKSVAYVCTDMLIPCLWLMYPI